MRLLAELTSRAGLAPPGYTLDVGSAGKIASTIPSKSRLKPGDVRVLGAELDRLYSFTINTREVTMEKLENIFLRRINIALLLSVLAWGPVCVRLKVSALDGTTGAGRFLYVSGLGENLVHQYEINRNDGVLTANGSAASGNLPRALVAHPLADFIYLSNENSNNAYQFSVGSAGDLSLLGTAGAGNNSRFAAIHPDGLALYVGNFGDASITPMLIDGVTGL